MTGRIINWRTFFALIAIIFVIGTIFYSKYLSDKIIKEEQKKLQQWVEASHFMDKNVNADLTLPLMIKIDQQDIPIIETDENDSIASFVNLDTTLAKNPDYLKRKLKE